MRSLDNFIELKYNQYLSKYGTENLVLFKGFYFEFDNEYLNKIFAIFHSSLNDLFSFMNDKKNSNGGHFNADESRELIDIIKQIRILEAKLKDEYSFGINKYYLDIINECRNFLSSSGGSLIPKHLPTIEIIEDRPIFTKKDIIEIQSLERTKKNATLQQIGGGSYAKVFDYTDPHYGIKFAIKRAKNDLREDELQRFKNEFQDLKDLDSSFIIKVYTYNEEKNEYTMELADQTLEKFMKYNNNTLAFEIRRNLVIQLLHAFDYIHKRGILHRDISYQNILIKKFEDGYITIKVSDFGLVKRPYSSLTRNGTETKGAINDYSDLDIVGFENYEIRHETYALAKVIYFILTNRVSKYHQEDNEILRNFIMKAIGNKNNRFKSVADMRKKLLDDVIPSMNKELASK